MSSTAASSVSAGSSRAMLHEDAQKKSVHVNDFTAGIIYEDRFNSFVHHDWPYSEPEGDLCNPREVCFMLAT